MDSGKSEFECIIEGQKSGSQTLSILFITGADENVEEGVGAQAGDFLY